AATSCSRRGAERATLSYLTQLLGRHFTNFSPLVVRHDDPPLRWAVLDCGEDFGSITIVRNRINSSRSVHSNRCPGAISSSVNPSPAQATHLHEGTRVVYPLAI